MVTVSKEPTDAVVKEPSRSMLPSTLVIFESAPSTVDFLDGAGSNDLRSWAAILLLH